MARVFFRLVTSLLFLITALSLDLSVLIDLINMMQALFPGSIKFHSLDFPSPLCESPITERIVLDCCFVPAGQVSTN